MLSDLCRITNIERLSQGELRVHLHIVLIGDCTDTEEEESGANHLVQDASLEGQVMTWVCSKDGRRVRSDSVSSSIMFIPDQSLPVDKEDTGRGHECPKILRCQIMGNLSPRKLAQSGESYRDCWVDVAT